MDVASCFLEVLTWIYGFGAILILVGLLLNYYEAGAMEIKKKAKITTNDLYYDLFEGGHLKPEEILEHQKDIDEVNKAISVINRLRKSLENSDNFEYR